MTNAHREGVAPVHNSHSDYSIFDEAFLGCADGHCLFDQDGKLVSWSDTFAHFYKPIIDKIVVGYEYRIFLRDLIENRVLKNMRPIDNIEEWLARQLDLIKQPKGEFIHHLENDEIMLIKHVRLSNGYWFFAAFDITELRNKREELAISKNKFQAFAQLSSDWFWELDSDLCYLYHSTHNSPVGFDANKDMVGMRRSSHVEHNAYKNEQLKLHNECLRLHKPVDVILTWQKNANNLQLVGQPDQKDNNEKNGFLHTHIQAKPIYNRQGIFTGYIGCGKDVTKPFRLAQKMEHLARHDDLTGLLNRRAFTESLDDLLTGESNTETPPLMTLIFLDLDQFKLVNDGAGHQAGDQLLKEISFMFSDTFGPRAVISRLGGDEFGIVHFCRATEAIDDVEDLIKKISSYKFHWANRVFSIGASAGIVEISEPYSDSSDLLSCADIACYGAKVSGRNQAQLYSHHNPFHRQQNEELSIIKLLNDSLNNNGLNLFLQPQIPTQQTDLPHKFEVLLRVWDNDRLIPPGDLIPVAEKYDRMQQIDLWVLENSISNLKKFSAAGVDCAFSVNLSGNTLSDEYCLSRISHLVENSQIEPGTLCFEITETTAIKGIEKARNFIKHLKQCGCEFSLDDFGSGLSSFSYLKSLDVDYLKIDGSFVKNIEQDYASRAIVKSFNTLGHEMGMKTVAEFVENDTIATLLTEIGIDYLQGYGVGKPQDIDQWFDNMVTPYKMTGT